MRFQSIITYSTMLVLLSGSLSVALASGTMTEDDIAGVSRQDISTESERQQIQAAAGLLAEYEIEAGKLLDALEEGTDSQTIRQQASDLLGMSETVIDSAKFRLPQCKEYLDKTMVLKDTLADISHEVLERDFHLDGALPKAGEECYHTKDLYVHPATVVVLTRDDPALEPQTQEQIKAEMTEVLAHTELVRQLVLY